MNIYKECPTLNGKRFLIRLFNVNDCNDLLKVYSDKKALPFFNSDNCDGDNFYYDTIDRMKQAIDFWKLSYDNGWFVRLSIVDKNVSMVIGTIEICLRVSNDEFNNMGILRVDVRSDYEEEPFLQEIFELILPNLEEMLGCSGIITKAPIYAIERIKAISKIGFTKSNNLLIGKNDYAYDGYWIIKFDK